MAEEMGLILNILPKLNKAQMDMVKAQINAQMSQLKAVEVIKDKPGSYAAREAQLRAEMANIKALKMGAPGTSKSEAVGKGAGEGFVKEIQGPLKSLMKGDLLGGLKGLLPMLGGGGAPGGGGVGGGLMGAGLAGGLAGGIVSGVMMGMDALKNIAIKIFDFMKQSSPLLQRSLKMLSFGFQSAIRPFADTLGRILQPIARFFMLWGRALYKEYREKYKEYVAGGMSPIEASIKASTEAFIEGIVGLFTGAIGDIDLGTNIMEIVGGIVDAFLTSLSDPAVFIDVLLIGGMIVGALGTALALAALTFLAAAEIMAGLISAAAGTGLTDAATKFLTEMEGIASEIGSKAKGAIGMVGWLALFVGIAAALELAMRDAIDKMFPDLPIPGGPPMGEKAQELWDLLSGKPTGWFQHGGVFSKPTVIGVGEAGPEAVIPLNKLGTSGRATTVYITITGNTISKDVDLERLIDRSMDDYMRKFERGR